MFILVAGGGKVGYFLARDLLKKGHEVVVIEKISEKCKLINEEMGSLAICGDACDPSLLETAGGSRAEIVVSVTGDDEDNLIICQVAKTKFEVPFTVATVKNPLNREIFQQLGIDATVSTTELLLSTIEETMAYKGVMTSLPVIPGVDVQMMEICLPESSPARNQTLKDLPLPKECTISMVVRGKDVLIPDGGTILQSKDLVIVLTKSENADKLRKLLLGEAENQMRLCFNPAEKL